MILNQNSVFRRWGFIFKLLYAATKTDASPGTKVIPEERTHVNSKCQGELKHLVIKHCIQLSYVRV